MLNIQKNYPLSKLTTLKIGGPAKEFVEVVSETELLEAISYARQKNLQFKIIGGGSNLLISDFGYDGLVVKNNISGVKGKNKTVISKAGTPLQELVDFANSHGFSGIHKLTGIPGTVGGAVYGNAAAYGQTISDYITEVVVFDTSVIPAKAEIHKNKSNGFHIKYGMTRSECQFDYRDSGFKKNGFIILEIKFTFPKGDSVKLQKEADEILQKRLQKYKPGILCPGSFFKNVLIENLTEEQKKVVPKERDYYGKVPAWYFLNEVGARGDKLGEIQIADFQGNLFMNQGSGTAKDFYNLAQKYYLKVKAKFGIKLEPEVQLINLPPFG